MVRAYGYADIERDRTLRPSDPIEIASVTKQLVATGILRLVDERRISLDDPAARFIPALEPHYSTVTVRQLLGHTSGIGYVDDQLVGNPPRDDAGAVAVIADAGYRKIGTALPISATGAAAGMCSTVDDLGRWTIALHGGKLLSAASYRAMTTPASGRPSGYGSGMVIGSFRGHRTFFHPGGTSSGARSLVAYFPDDALVVVLLVNAQPVDLDRVEAAITDAWFDTASPAAPF